MIIEIKGMRDLSERQKNKTVRKIIFTVLALFILTLAVFGFVGYRYVTNALDPVDASSEEVVEIEVPSGSNRRDIALILEEEDLIESALVFDYYVRFQGENSFQAGTYLMSPSMSVDEIITYLNEGGTPIAPDPVERVSIPEGIHIENIAERMNEHTDFSEEEFMALIQDEAFIEELVSRYPELLEDALEAAEETRYILEGYLFPATYEVFEETTLENLVTQMITQMDRTMVQYYEEIEESAYNVHEILTLASYIEREGVTNEDRELISGVFYNRLEAEMPLQTDPSVAYALGEHREFTTYEDLEIDSPYNTYMYPGIGAGPINSPSASAIEAAVQPVDTEYMYFLADIQTGEVYYSTSYEDHLILQEEHVGNGQ